MRAAFVCAALMLAACSPPSGPPAGASGGAAFRLERFCSAPDLPASLRHTYLLIDEHAISKAETPADFASLNAGLRDVVVAFSDPNAATLSGAMDYRERLSILMLPADGSAAKLLFEGCLPALSPEELAAAQDGSSAAATFFTGGIQQQLHNDGDEFRSRAVAAIVLAARAAAGEAAPETAALPQTKLMQSLRASGRLIDADDGLPRVILLANLARTDVGADRTREGVRTAAFHDGAENALDLGRSELHIFLADGPNAELAREYAQAFFLVQNANLISWAGSAPGALPQAPVSVQRFAGEAAYPNGPEAIQVRIAVDRNDNLVNSWMVLRGSPNRSTPLTGPQTCSAPGACHLSSDDGGFAQAWTSAPGGEPDFVEDIPFGGLREWEIDIQDARLTGAIRDAAVQQIGPTPGNDSIRLTAQRADEATF